MNNEMFDAALGDWIAEGPERGPRHGLERALAATRRVNQRPAWTFPRRFLPRPLAQLHPRVPSSVAVGLALVVLLLLALAIAVGVGRPRVRLPIMPAANRAIAFQEGPAIYSARQDGTERHKLSEDVPYAHSPVFSPDGTQVAFVASLSATDTAGRLLVAAFDGSAPLIDVSHQLEVVGGQVPSVTWSPDGIRLAFAARLGGVSRIYVTASVGGEVVPVTDASADADLPTWSPQGDRIAFRVTDPGGAQRHIMAVHPDGSGLETLNTMITADSSFSKPRFAPENGQLAYAVNYGFGARTRALIDWGFGHNAEIWTDGIGGFPDAGIPFSPDGNYLAFITATDGVIVAEEDTTISGGYDGELRRLGNVADCWIEWVPDGKSLYGGSPDGCAGVVVIPLDDPTAARRLPTATSGFASWQLLLP